MQQPKRSPNPAWDETSTRRAEPAQSGAVRMMRVQMVGAAASAEPARAVRGTQGYGNAPALPSFEAESANEQAEERNSWHETRAWMEREDARVRALAFAPTMPAIPLASLVGMEGLLHGEESGVREIERPRPRPDHREGLQLRLEARDSVPPAALSGDYSQAPAESAVQGWQLLPTPLLICIAASVGALSAWAFSMLIY
jgi:hypothetical protein